MISAIVLSLAVTSAPASSSPLKIAVVELGASVADAGLAGAATSAVVRAMASLKELPKGSTVLGPEELMSEAGANVVAPAVVQRIKGMAAPRTLLDGTVPEALTSDEVDALLGGIVEYKAGAGFAGTHSVEADLSMQLMKVDTGDVLASEQKHVRHPTHTENAAQKGAADRLCQQIRPALEAALKKRSARGVRVVVTVGGVDADAAGALAAALEKGASLARARVKNVTAKGATVQVTLSGGDGVALALEVPRLEPTYVVSTASAGQLTLARSPSKAEGAP
jgi:hypothetical protein